MNWHEPFTIVNFYDAGFYNLKAASLTVLAVVLNLFWMMMLFGLIAFSIGIGLRLAL